MSILVLLAGPAIALTGCVAPPDVAYGAAMSRGEFGEARAQLMQRMTNDRTNRSYLLDRLKLGIAALADGVPQAAERPLDEVYTVLRTQGVNKDKEVAAVILNEDLKIWKGEPFEQAFALYYVSLYNAMIGQWGNARAAAGNSLFQLRDFGSDRFGNRLESDDLIRKAMSDEDYLDVGYVETDTNFALGYLVNALANQALGRDEEAGDNYGKAVKIDQRLADVVSNLEAKANNTILLVELGPGPQKIATGPDQAIARFRPLLPSDQRPLRVTIEGESILVPIACDVNEMARDHMWNNLEDVRLAKSTIGDVLMIGGGATSIYGLGHDNNAAALAGLGMLLAGAFAKAGAHADTRYCEGLPQRVYLAAASIDRFPTSIELQVEGIESARATLNGLAPPQRGQVQLCFVRLPAPGYGLPAWATSDRVLYCNDAMCPPAGATGAPRLPFILGGDCVRSPSWDALRSYQEAGFLQGMTLSELEEFYRMEGITIVENDPGAPTRVELGLHVLEGGAWLYTPLPGTAGFGRLFCQPHAPYRPRSPQVQALSAEIWKAPGTGESGAN